MRTHARLGWIPVLLLFSLTVLNGCSDDDDQLMMTPGPEPGTALVRVGHLSPDAGPVDVWVDGSVALPNVDYLGFSDYLSLPEGDHQVQITPVGASSPIVIDETVTLADGVAYSVIATGLASGGSNPIGATVLVDDRVPSGTNAKVRFVHTSPDAPPVDITLTDGTKLFSNVAFNGSASIEVGGGAYDLQVRLASTDTVVLSFGDVAVGASTNYSVYAIGQVSDGSLTAIVTVDAPGTGSVTADLTPANGELRVAHLSPNAGPVDIWLDDAVVTGLTNVDFEAVSGYLSVSAASHRVRVFAAGTTTNPAIDATIIVDPNVSYTVAATGLASDLQPIVLVDDRTPGTMAHVRFVHASPDAPAVDVEVDSGPTLFSGVTFRQATDYLNVAGSTYDLNVLISADRSLALAVPNVTLTDGVNTTIFAIGQAGDASLDALPATDTP